MKFTDPDAHLRFMKKMIHKKVDEWRNEAVELGDELDGDYQTSLQIYASAAATFVGMVEEVIRCSGGEPTHKSIGTLGDIDDDSERN